MSSLEAWEDLVDDFLRHKRANREENTTQFYDYQLRQFVRWIQAHRIALRDFRARHLDAYLEWRGCTPSVKTGKPVCDNTRRHDAVSVMTLMKFAVRREFLASNPLKDYEIPKATLPYVRMPSAEELGRILDAVRSYWDRDKNPKIRNQPPLARRYFRLRDYTILCLLIETATRINEVLSLELDDYDAAGKQISIRDPKGDDPRMLPLSQDCLDAVEEWLKVRRKLELGACRLLFINRYGRQLMPGSFNKMFNDYKRFAGVSGFTLHGVRHFSLTQLVETNDIPAAARIAGHKSWNVTMRYTHTSAERVRKAHEQAKPLEKVMRNKRSQQGNSRKPIV